MGLAPGTVYATAERRDGVDEKALRVALAARARRRVRRDTTLNVDDEDWELACGPPRTSVPTPTPSAKPSRGTPRALSR